MRHLTRLYFDNPAQDGATELFISVVDHGVDAHKSPVYSVMTGKISNPMTLAEQYQVLRYLQSTACFFKLPIGASATVDVYVPDDAGSVARKIFDYQITKARIPEKNAESSSAALHSFKSVAGLQGEGQAARSADATASNNGGGSAREATSSPALFNFDGGGVGLTCHSGAPCGNETSIPCGDPLTQKAVCKDGRLVCVDI